MYDISSYMNTPKEDAFGKACTTWCDLLTPNSVSLAGLLQVVEGGCWMFVLVPLGYHAGFSHR